MMVRIIIMITSTPLTGTKIKNAKGLGPEAPPPGSVGEAVALCWVGKAVASCCVEVVFDVGDALVEVDIGELEEGLKLDPVSCADFRPGVTVNPILYRQSCCGQIAQQFGYMGSGHKLYPFGQYGPISLLFWEGISLVFWAARQKVDERSNVVEERRGFKR